MSTQKKILLGILIAIAFVMYKTSQLDIHLLVAPLLTIVIVTATLWAWWHSGDNLIYQCPKCTSVFMNDKPNRHVLSKEGFTTDGETIVTYQCSECGYEWSQHRIANSWLATLLGQ